MAKHFVTCVIPKREIKNANTEFKIRKNSEIVGTLKVSKGGVEWFRKSARRSHQVKWEKFAEIMEDRIN